MVGWHAPNAKTSMNMRYLIRPLANSFVILAKDKRTSFTMRTQYIIALSSMCGIACGSAPTDPPSNQQGIGMEDKPVSAAMAMPAGSGMADPPTSEAGAPAMSGSSSGSVISVNPPTEAGVASGVISGSSESSGSASGSSGMSEASGAETGNMSGAAASCVGAATQVCGNCASGTATRVCNNGVWSDYGSCQGAQAQDLGELSSQGGVGVGNFTISFDLVDTDYTTDQAVVNQQLNCLGSVPYWDIQLNATGCGNDSIAVQHYSATEGLITHCTSVGSWELPATGYQVVIHRAGSYITLTAGGNRSDNWGDATDWDAYSSVVIGSTTSTCQKTEGAMPLNGTVSNVCVEKE
jgi:hypothetical protein